MTLLPTLLALALAPPDDPGPRTRPYLGLPADASARPPALLSRTGAFADVAALTPSPALIPYDLNVPFWSDGAEKSRWLSVPRASGEARATIRVEPSGVWTFPAGTVFVKHFEIATDGRNPRRRRRLETRLLVVDPGGGVRGYSYRWRPDGSDADLVDAPRAESIVLEAAEGPRTQTWPYPGPDDCRQCHTPASGGVLGVNARQIHRDVRDPTGVVRDQLRTWARLGLLSPRPSDAEVASLPRLARSDDPSRSLEDRARSFLDANCAQCHRPGGVAADFDARFETPIGQQRMIGEPSRINLGIDGARLIAPNDPWRSTILARVETLEPTKMPPLAHNVVDRRGADLLRAWIASLPGPPVVAPPTIAPPGGDSPEAVRVAIRHDDPGVAIRYTLDGSAPGATSPIYEGPLEIRRSTTVRARAFKAGHRRSIAVQETWIIGE